MRRVTALYPMATAERVGAAVLAPSFPATAFQAYTTHSAEQNTNLNVAMLTNPGIVLAGKFVAWRMPNARRVDAALTPPSAASSIERLIALIVTGARIVSCIPSMGAPQTSRNSMFSAATTK